jgi:hypothetical protein
MQITDYWNYPNSVQVQDVHVFMHDSGMVSTHDYSCPVCREDHAVLDLSSGIMQPCWSCQEKGYVIIKRSPPRKKFLGIV